MTGGRELAWRVLTSELRAATEEEPAQGERSAAHLISPAGARLNRVLIAGTLAPAENAGRDPNQPFWRAELTDPTGGIPVTAGGFQPRALEVLKDHREPGPVLVLGKVHLYRGRDGQPHISIRAEEIARTTPERLAEIQREAVDQTLDRIAAIAGAARSGPGPDGPGRREELPSAWRRGAELAIARYPGSDARGLRQLVGPYFGQPAAGPRAPPPVATVAGPVAAAPRSREVRRTETTRPSVARPPGDHAQESILLDIVDELAEGSDDGYADLRDATQMARARGIGPHRLEELLMRLEEDGVLEEPIVGKLRRA